MASPGFIAGMLLGAGLAGAALALGQGSLQLPADWLTQPSTVSAAQPLLHWIEVNLGFSVWLFALVLAFYGVNLYRLQQLLAQSPVPGQAVELDQLSDVWIHLFIGIGVIWTAVGMRSALQAALADPADALTDTAGNVLRDRWTGAFCWRSPRPSSAPSVVI